MTVDNSNNTRIASHSDLANLLKAHPAIDKLIKTNVYSYYLVYFTLTVFFITQSIRHYSWGHVTSGIAGGLIIWSLTEYTMHRFLFHWNPRNLFEKVLVYALHDVHHAYPRDVSRSITPLAASLPLAALFYFIFQAVFGKYAISIFPGFLLGYMIYTIIHDSTHHFPMNFSLAKQLKRHHMRHHYFDNRKNFGVSSPIWDYIFRTYSKG
ncbi:hypothetical protein AQUSIP_16310 [Aquicella siphonis]|uniref:Fatty acid hydroxylase domain-containing protein n=1 Tax=Aquicella siphonis TaxID=254247 RepID=A0A5E4PGY8_9COXI|nr:sterol desaturase family protein [Aquicella siphonis]VVC76320.1 hypothetical protein AQUSIP_16310 [Aquicella siphonis]